MQLNIVASVFPVDLMREINNFNESDGRYVDLEEVLGVDAVNVL
jgi:hypothetical protein